MEHLVAVEGEGVEEEDGESLDKQVEIKRCDRCRNKQLTQVVNALISAKNVERRSARQGQEIQL